MFDDTTAVGVTDALSALQPLGLDSLKAGQCARFHQADLTCDDCAMLSALGLNDQCRFRVCRSGVTCILQVGGTRIGLSRRVAEKITVVPE